jgi:hypothetical protein
MEELKLAAGHSLSDGVVGPLRRNPLAHKLKQVVDLNGD